MHCETECDPVDSCCILFCVPNIFCKRKLLPHTYLCRFSPSVLDIVRQSVPCKDPPRCAQVPPAEVGVAAGVADSVDVDVEVLIRAVAGVVAEGES